MTTTATVDTSLAAFDVPTLMTKAFELTHRLDGLAQYNGTPQGARAIGEVREQRDAIVREMQRRSDGMERALATVEAAERILVGIDGTLTIGNRDLSVTADRDRTIFEVRTMVDLMVERTTSITCTLVKDQTISDRISKAARDIVRPIRAATSEEG